MSRIKRLFLEVHQRSLWQALAVYLGASWAVVEAVGFFEVRFGLPKWLVPVALVLLLLGLALRLGYLWEVRDSMLFDVLLIDSHTYDEFALKILDGTFHGEEVYSMNILYPYFLAAVYTIFGRSWLAVGIVQSVNTPVEGSRRPILLPLNTVK